MKCQTCKEQAVIKNYCKKHFIEYFEKKVEKTTSEFDMLSKDDKIAVGCSGGKDSLTTLYILKKLGYNVTALAIDEGIEGYRDPEFKLVKEFCKQYNIPLKMKSFKKSFGKTLDTMHTKIVGGKPCTTCGTLRRHLLNKHSEGFDKIATGHNLDDEAQSVLMNLFKSQIFMFPRTGPITREVKGFTRKIKPLYFMKEKETATYAFLMKFLDKFTECPNAHLAYRIHLRDLMNEYESENPGTKEKVLIKHMEIVKKMGIKEVVGIKNCERCGDPSSRDVCKTCEIKVKI